MATNAYKQVKQAPDLLSALGAPRGRITTRDQALEPALEHGEGAVIGSAGVSGQFWSYTGTLGG